MWRTSAAHLDGRCVLESNGARDIPAEILALSKRRAVPKQYFRLIKGLLAVRPVYMSKEKWIRARSFCTIVALLAFALLELLAQRGALAESGTALLASLAMVSVLPMVLQDGRTLRRITGLAPPLAATLQTLCFPPAVRYVPAQY